MNIRMIVLTVAIATSFIQGIGDAVAACSSDDFKITSFEPSEKDRAGGRKVYSLKGVLVNNCAEAAAAELKVDAKNDGGEIIHTERSEEHTSELQSLMRISYAVFCLKKKKHTQLR